jgi:SAM-dependent methyltransferase
MIGDAGCGASPGTPTSLASALLPSRVGRSSDARRERRASGAAQEVEVSGALAIAGRAYDRAFAAVYDRVLAGPERAGLGRAREGLLADARGRVLEIGAGTGANLSPLCMAPSGTLSSLVLVEPSEPMRARLARRVSALRDRLPDTTRIVAGSADALPVEDGSVDTLISTLVLCSVPDVDAAVAELRRVLAPDGRLLLLEHVAGDGRTRRLQGAIDPAWRVVARGCRLVRDTRAALERGGFDTSEVGPWRLPGGGVTGPAILGTARPR